MLVVYSVKIGQYLVKVYSKSNSKNTVIVKKKKF